MWKNCLAGDEFYQFLACQKQILPIFVIVKSKHGDIDWNDLKEQLGSYEQIADLNVPAPERIAGTLSGGNVQRMTFARAVISNPSFLIACYPSRGLDVATVAAVHRTLVRLRNNGVAIVLISEDLGELFELSDELVVLSAGKVYGPYPNAYAAKEVVDLLNRMYPLRKCRKLPKKECLYYHMGQCLAPCINKVDKSIYDDIKNKINSILKGNVHDEIKKFKVLMNEASDNLDFEKAIEYRNIINSLEQVSQRQKMEEHISDTDVFGYFANDDYLSIQVFHIREGKMIERNGYLFENDGNIVEKYQEFVYNFYLVENNPFPKQIFLKDINEEELQSFNDILDAKVIVPKVGRNLELVKLVCDNAKNKIDNLIRKKELEYQRTEKTFKDLSNLLGFEVHKVEAFDNSNIQGASAVSAMVVYIDGKKAKNLYRKFKIKTVVGANDVATMYEVVTRRYKDIESKPDLIIMDGGKLQVDSCKKALKDINQDIEVLGLVKDDNHKTRALFYNDKEIEIEKGSYLFHMMEAIQEEVHRFAISFFRSTHNKNLFTSKLDEIKGIGKVKKNQILKFLSSNNFKEDLDKLKLNDYQKEEILKAYKII